VGREERDAVESRKLKVERQPKRRRIQRHEKLPDKVGTGRSRNFCNLRKGRRRDTRAGMHGRMTGLAAQYQISYYYTITIPVKKYLEVIRIS
jgi:hypothetical protein